MDRAITFDNIKDSRQLVISFHSFKSGYIVRPHWHDFFELEIVLSGTARHILNGSTSNISENDSFILMQNDFHSIEILTDTVFFNISFNSSTIDTSIINTLSCENGAICSKIKPEFAETLKCLRNFDFEKHVFSQLIKKDIAELSIINIITNAGLNKKPRQFAVNECVRLINADFRKNLSLEKTAKKLYLTPNHLGFIFKKSLGCSFRKYLNRVRLRYACALLSATDYSVKEIALMSGYGSSEYFAFAFKSAFGVSPDIWRKQSI